MPTPRALPKDEEFIPLAPLYVPFALDTPELNRLLQYTGRFRAYCPGCKDVSIFVSTANFRQPPPGADVRLAIPPPTGRIHITTACQINSGHLICAYLQFMPSRIWKIGQTPSLAEMLEPQAQRFKRVLGEQRHKELTKAYRLAGGGVGIGSFVYLRRIFEHLVAKAWNAALNDGGVKPEHEGTRMDEKIQLLHHYLPEVLVENRAMYGILSLGVHELEEADCLAHFPIVRDGIELILDHKLEELRKAEARKRLSQDVGALKGKLSPPAKQRQTPKPFGPQQ